MILLGCWAIVLSAACTNDFGLFEPKPDGGVTQDASSPPPADASTTVDAGPGNDAGNRQDATGGDGGCTVSQACLSAAGQCRSTCRTQRGTCESACPGGGPNRQQCMDGCRNQEGTCKNTCEATCNTCATQSGCPAPSACRNASQ